MPSSELKLARREEVKGKEKGGTEGKGKERKVEDRKGKGRMCFY